MTITAAIALIIATAIFAATPGPGVFAAVSQSLSHGFRAGLYTVFGIILGDLIFLMFAIWGLAAVAQAMGELFLVVKLLGAAYLIWLGWKMWTSEPVPLDVQNSTSTHQVKHSFLAGLFITLSNPKVILFYLGFLPTFVDLHSLTVMDILLVVSIISTVLLLVLSGYAYLAARTRRLFTQRRALIILNRSAGTVMMGVGATLVVHR